MEGLTIQITVPRASVAVGKVRKFRLRKYVICIFRAVAIRAILADMAVEMEDRKFAAETSSTLKLSRAKGNDL